MSETEKLWKESKYQSYKLKNHEILQINMIKRFLKNVDL